MNYYSGKGVIVRKLADLETDEQVVVIGTVYKQQELKPNILREISDEVCWHNYLSKWKKICFIGSFFFK